MLVDALKNLSLDEVASQITYIGLHSQYPGDTGTNEMSGGSPAYARRAVSWSAASTGVLTTSGALDSFDVPAGATVAFGGFWSAASGGDYLGCIPLGPVGDPMTVVASEAGVFTAPGHTLTNGTPVTLLKTLGSLPTGVTAGNIYYVRDVSGDTFKVSSTPGGAAISIAASGRAMGRAIISETYGGQGLYTISSLTVVLA